MEVKSEKLKIKSDVGMSWQLTSLGTLIEVLSGFAFDSKKFSDSIGKPLIRIRDIKRSYTETFYNGNFEEKYIVKSGDVLIGMDGEFNVAEWNGTDALLNQRVCKITVKDTKCLDLRYLLYFLPFQLKLIEDKASFVTVKHLSVNDIKNIQIPLPPLATQKRIAEILDAADALRRKDQELLEKYDELAQAIFVDMFGDPVKNEKGWEVKTIGDSIDFITSGSRGWAQFYSESGDLFLRINNVGYNEIKLRDLIYVKAPDNAEANRTKVQAGDILMSITADLGRTCVIPCDFPKAYINQHLAILRLKPQFEPNFVSQFFTTEFGKNQFKKLNKGGVKAGLNFEDIKSLEFINPPLEFQKKYSEALRELRNHEEFNRLRIEKTNDLFSTLIQKAFKGELVS